MNGCHLSLSFLFVFLCESVIDGHNEHPFLFRQYYAIESVSYYDSLALLGCSVLVQKLFAVHINLKKLLKTLCNYFRSFLNFYLDFFKKFDIIFLTFNNLRRQIQCLFSRPGPSLCPRRTGTSFPPRHRRRAACPRKRLPLRPGRDWSGFAECSAPLTMPGMNRLFWLMR